MDADASPSLVARRKMQQMRHPCAVLPSCFYALWHTIGCMILVILFIFGGPIELTSILEAQASRPAAAPAPGFSPPTPFRYLNRFPPYPEESLNSGEEGVVLVRISITNEGKVNLVKVLRSSGSRILDETTANWIKNRWRYHPATQNGVPVASAEVLSVRFAVNK